MDLVIPIPPARVQPGQVWNIKFTSAATRRVIAVTWDETYAEHVVTFYTDPGEGYAFKDGYSAGYHCMILPEFLRSVETNPREQR